MINLKNKKNIFYITGLSGSGKTTIAKKIYKSIKNRYGPTIEVSGDDLRNIFNIKKYDLKNRKIIAKQFSSFCKYIQSKGFNVLFSTVSLYETVRVWNRKNLKNYCEIYIKADIKKIIKFSSKKIYKNKKRNIVGIHFKPEFPKNPNIIIENDFTKSTNKLSSELFKKIIRKVGK